MLETVLSHLKLVGVSSKNLRVFLESLRESSGIFGNSRIMFGNVRLAFATILENLRKSSESGRKSSENRQKRRHQYVYIIKRTLHVSSKIWILCSCHSNIKFISSRHRVISSIQCQHATDDKRWTDQQSTNPLIHMSPFSQRLFICHRRWH